MEWSEVADAGLNQRGVGGWKLMFLQVPILFEQAMCASVCNNSQRKPTKEEHKYSWKYEAIRQHIYLNSSWRGHFMEQKENLGCEGIV